MVDYEKGLGDLGFRGHQGAELGRRLGLGEAPSRRLGETLGAAATCRRTAARVRVWVVLGVGKRGSRAPSFIGGRAWEEGALPQVGLLGRRVEGGGLPPQVGFLLSLHQANLSFDFSNWRLTFQTRI